MPATAYFEWRDAGRHKLKNRISLENGGLMAFAGLCDGERFTIVTCPPAPSISYIHDRMPVILGATAEAPWLDNGIPFRQVAALLRPYSGPLAAREELPPDGQTDLFGA